VIRTPHKKEVDMAILYDESHKEASFEKYYSDLHRHLTKSGETVDIFKNGPITAEALNGYTVLVISFPQKKFQTAEINCIKDFVEKGGGIFLVGEEWNFNNFKDYLNSISKKFNITFNSDEILDPKNRVLDSPHRIGDYYFTLRTFSDHPIVEGLDEFVIYGGCSLKLNGEGDIIVKGSEYCYSSEGYYKAGEFPPVLASIQSGKGKVVCLGDGSLLRDSFIQEGNNKQLTLNIISWLTTASEPEELGEEGVLQGIEELEQRYNELDLKYSSNSISYEEYQKSIEEFGEELASLESKLKYDA
jgi:uncharacterized membrane protein